MSAVQWLVLEPLDTLVVRDGRSFDAGQQNQAHAVLPSPATIAGAIGAAYGANAGAGRFDPEALGRDLPEQVHGPITAYRGDGGWEARWPVPQDIQRDHASGTLSRLRAMGDDMEFDLDADVEVLLTGSQPPGDAVADGWWDTGALSGYLHEGEASPYLCDQPWQVERRVGLARGPDRTAAEGMLYAAEHLRLRDGHGFAARCVGGPNASLPQLTNLGGRGRRAVIHKIDAPEVPAPLDDFPGGRLLLYLATSAVFPGGSWRPDMAALAARWPGVRLVTAAIGAIQVITTAVAQRSDGSIGDGLLMWAVPPGSVYYLRFPDANTAAEAAAELHDRPLTQAETWMRTAGFGLAYTGRWTRQDDH